MGGGREAGDPHIGHPLLNLHSVGGSIDSVSFARTSAIGSGGAVIRRRRRPQIARPISTILTPGVWELHLHAWNFHTPGVRTETKKSGPLKRTFFCPLLSPPPRAWDGLSGGEVESRQQSRQPRLNPDNTPAEPRLNPVRDTRTGYRCLSGFYFSTRQPLFLHPVSPTRPFHFFNPKCASLSLLPP